MKVKRLLVVDDSEGTRYVISTWLRREGYDVAEAATGEEALRIASAGNIDMAVLDVNLPDMTGYEVCEAIKARESGIPVLHVSSTNVAPSDRSEGLRRGADGFLTEPVERQELLASVAALLRGAEAERTARRLADRLTRLNDATLAVNEAKTLVELAAYVVFQSCALFDAPARLLLDLTDTSIIAACEPKALPSVNVYVNRAAVPVEAAPAAVFVSADFKLVEEQRGVLLIYAREQDAEQATAGEAQLVLEQFARAASTAVNNMIGRDIERRIALTLQHSLLPQSISPIRNANVAVRYMASSEHAEVGGDFYEFFALDDERIAFAVGDVVGHSIEAAAIMAQIRSAIRAYILEGHAPAQTLERVDNVLQRFHPGASATVCCAMYNRRTGEGELANAGHPPPITLTSAGACFHELGDALLGAGNPNGRTSAPFTLGYGDRLVLYTDGLVERREESIDTGLARLKQAITRFASLDIESLCDAVLKDVSVPHPEDDIALVVIERCGDR